MEKKIITKKLKLNPIIWVIIIFISVILIGFFISSQVNDDSFEPRVIRDRDRIQPKNN